MSKYKVIAVVYGSDSSEWEVSCRGGEFVASRIDQNAYDVYEIFARFGKWQLVAYRKRNSMHVPLPEGSRPEVDKSDFSVNVLGEKIKFDFAYIVQHGKPGENGLLQGYFEMLGIPFSSCSSFVATTAFDKYACKSYIRDLGIVKCAPDAFVHKGADLKANIGDTIYAAFTGKVRLTKFERNGYGFYVILRHDNGLETVYGHLSKFLVKENQYVKAGTPIALSGNTGRSTGPHLHFETRYMGVAINPEKIFDFVNGNVYRDHYTFNRSSSDNADNNRQQSASKGRRR